MAGWSLGLAIFPSIITWVIAVVFACLVLSRAKDGRNHGQRMSVAALVIVGLWIATAVVVVVALVATGAHRDEDGRVTDSGRVTVSGLQVGDCVPSVHETNEQYMVDVVPCAEPHTAEVFATFDLDGKWTSREDVEELGQYGCYDRFRDYVGVAPRRSTLSVLYFAPFEETQYAHDPEVICLLVTKEPGTEALKGSRR
jgi:hypothetical protein